MYVSIKKFIFLNIFISSLGFPAFVSASEERKRGFEGVETSNFDSNVFYRVLDINKTGLNKLSLIFQEGFDVNEDGNIIYSQEPFLTMYPDDTNKTSSQNFSSYEIPKLYLMQASVDLLKTNPIDSMLRGYFKDKTLMPVIDKKLVGLSGKCKNPECLFSNNKIEKEVLIAIGGQDKENYGFWNNIYWVDKDNIGIPSSEDFPFKSLPQVVNAIKITAIGGSGENSFGFRNNGIVNTNDLVAIGGVGKGSDGFYNELKLNANNLVAIGGRVGSRGFSNYSSLVLNSIIAVGGVDDDSYGIFNTGKIETNLLVAIGGKKFLSVGVYNNKDIEADWVVALSSQNRGIGLLNTSNIATEVLSVIGNKRVALYNTGKINAQNIYLNGLNILKNTGSIKANNLVVSNFSSITGSLDFDSSKASSLAFVIPDTKWEASKNFFEIHNASFTLQPNTSIEVVFSNESMLKTNLTYDTTYQLLSIKGKGSLIDNRSDKAIKFSTLSLQPKTYINQQGISFRISQDSNPTTFSETDLSEKQKIINKIQSFSPKASDILNSIIQANNHGNNFQPVILDEGLKNINSNPGLLKTLIEQTDEMFQQNSTPMSVFSQKNIEYINQQVSTRINTIAMGKPLSEVFKQAIRKYQMASNGKTIFSPDFETSNFAWVNIGGLYYKNVSSGLKGSSSSSVNTTIGYDTEVYSDQDVDIVLGALFGYAKSFYTQSGQKETFDTYTLGIYSNAIIDKHEFQWVFSGSKLNADKKIHNDKIGIASQNYNSDNLALNISAFYKYKFALTEIQFIKPLILGNYSFLYTPATDSKTFSFNKAFDNIFALGVGAEYGIQTDSMGHIFQFSGRYHIKDITQSRAITFKGSQTFINYDLTPSRTWLRLSYNTKFYLTSGLSVEASLIGDMSLQSDFLGAGNLGLNYQW